MSIAKALQFKNDSGEDLSADLYFPANKKSPQFAVFAHCFTCSKNFGAVKSIVRALVARGLAVLSFDFTGLGSSEGNFSNTNFSSQIADVKGACSFLEKTYKAPSLLLGHSLGGLAVLFAAKELPSVKGIVTIGAPVEPEHVTRLIKDDISEIEKSGKALVNIGGQSFTIKKQFLDDIDAHQTQDLLKDLRKALLIFHAPQDQIVDVSNAASLFQHAFHPKSFISLDGADHLLTNAQDGKYVGDVSAAWASRYLPEVDSESSERKFQAVASISSDEDKYLTHLKAGNHNLLADEPVEVGGSDLGPSPYELLAAALGACTAITLKMYADRKQWNVGDIDVYVNHTKKHSDDCENCEQSSSKIDHFSRILEVSGQLSEGQRDRLLSIASKCPVHRTLEGNIHIDTTMKEDE